MTRAARSLMPAARVVAAVAALPILVAVGTLPVAAQTSSRPQLEIVRAEARLADETLVIDGRFFVWANDDQPVVLLDGTPLSVLNITETQIQARLLPGTPPGTCLLKVSRGSGAVQSDTFAFTLGAVSPAGPQGPPGLPGVKGESGEKGDQGEAGVVGDHLAAPYGLSAVAFEFPFTVEFGSHGPAFGGSGSPVGIPFSIAARRPTDVPVLSDWFARVVPWLHRCPRRDDHLAREGR